MIQEPIKQYTPQTNTINPVLQFLTITGVTVGLVIVFSAIAAGVIMAVFGMKTLTDTFAFNTSNPNLGSALWILQIVSTTIPLFLAPVIFARLIMNDTRDYLKPTLKFQPGFFAADIYHHAVFKPHYGGANQY
jgi:hypothetical protein